MQTAILLGLVYAFAWSMDNIAGSSFMDRPIVCGALTGLVMGNFEQGLVIGEHWNWYGWGLSAMPVSSMEKRVSGRF